MWVAAQTKHVHMLNVPLRSPAVLAHSAASLDLLSTGRLDLALGAGESWGEIESMGGRRLMSDEAIEALSEAIEVIRDILGGSSRTSLSFDGDYYQLSGAQPGPMPAHDIPVWVSGTQPGMLRLSGQKADGCPQSGPWNWENSRLLIK
jgi:alkanesulfonate monooxygenase SsuD/methylene tetrahydromethanopterin reductase-like flavin-dependent oxidoreductase (luciferase family)